MDVSYLVGYSHIPTDKPCDMRALFVLMLSMVITILTANAQFKEVSSSGGGFNIENGIATQDIIVVQGVTFPLMKTSKGSLFVVAISSTGKEYPVWVGEATNEKYNGQAVRKFNSGKYAYFILNKNGYPYAKYLTMN